MKREKLGLVLASLFCLLSLLFVPKLVKWTHNHSHSIIYNTFDPIFIQIQVSPWFWEVGGGLISRSVENGWGKKDNMSEYASLSLITNIIIY